MRSDADNASNGNRLSHQFVYDGLTTRRRPAVQFAKRYGLVRKTESCWTTTTTGVSVRKCGQMRRGQCLRQHSCSPLDSQRCWWSVAKDTTEVTFASWEVFQHRKLQPCTRWVMCLDIIDGIASSSCVEYMNTWRRLSKVFR